MTAGQRQDPSETGRLKFYRHAGRRPETLVLLVHGLGGRGSQTWEDLPELLLDQDAQLPGRPVDVAVFDYASGLRRLRRLTSAALGPVEKELTDEVLAASTRQ